MYEVSIREIKQLLLEETRFIEKMKVVREEVLQYGYYKSFKGGDLERIALEDTAMPMYVQYPYGVVAVQESGPFFCRGESKIYPSTKSTWDRFIPQNERERSVYAFIECMRLSELSMLFSKLKAVECSKRSEFNFSAVAQHYGFKTNFLDITNRLRIALFFACCIKEKDKPWRPLNKHDFILTDFADGRYGVLFIRDRFGCGTNLVMPIGYQPFLRCHSQYGYFIPMRSEWDLQDTASGFTMLCFKHDEKFCRYIFDLNEEGRLIYPDDTDSIFIPSFDKVRETNIFSREVFDIIYRHRSEIPFPFSKGYTKEMIIKELGDIKIIDDELILRCDIDAINRQWCRTCANREKCGISLKRSKL